jgi:putative DNA primase/helicase
MSTLRIPLHDKARGHWRSILPGLGMHASHLNGKNGPCPLCGGVDRFRFLDRNGDGTWICNQCNPRVKSGVTLALEFTGWPYKDLAQKIEYIIGDDRPTPAAPPKHDQRPWLRSLWREADPTRCGNVVDRYLSARGVSLDVYPQCLRSATRLWHKEAGMAFPGMLTLVTGPDGTPLTHHRTYLDPSRPDKASVNKPRMLCSELNGAPPTIRLTPPAAVMGVAEGIETAMAATKLFGIPTWSAIDASGIARFEPPPEAKHIIIFGDNDRHGTGQEAAYAGASRLAKRIKVDVRIPEGVKDWNDILLRERRR